MRPLDILKECKSLDWGIWQCPPFLFLIMGFITITSMVAVALLSSRYFTEPEIPTIVAVSFIASIFLIIGNAIISGFNEIAEANRIKSQFVSIISHQLRTPISVFKWTLESLQTTIKKPEQYHEIELSILNLVDANQKMIHLVNTLLDVTRIESHTLILQPEDILISDLVGPIVNNFQRLAQSFHIALAVENDVNILPVYADRQRIGTAIETLIDNAIRYTINHDGTIKIQTQQEGAFVRFSVADAGVGIPYDQQKNIFNKFFRASNSTQYQTQGTGIELFLAKYIIETSGGTIGFTSQEGVGSTFWFTLPVHKNV